MGVVEGAGASGEAEVPFINAFVRLREDGRRIAQSKEARSDPAAALQAILRLMDRCLSPPPSLHRCRRPTAIYATYRSSLN